MQQKLILLGQNIRHGGKNESRLVVKILSANLCRKNYMQ